MNKSTRVLGFVVGAMMCAVPLAGNAYFCKITCPECEEALGFAETDHKTKDIKSEDLLQTLNVKARSCVLMEKDSGKVILAKGEHQKLPMASMTKMMTMLLLMEEVEKGTIDLNQTTTISEYAASQEGSQCLLDANKQYKVKDLLKSIVVASANDSTVAIAELISGSEQVFAKKMNERATALGMKNTTYINSTGLDEAGHVSTAYDMCLVIKELSKYDILKDMSKTWMYDMEHPGGRLTSLTNTNRLIRTNPDCKFAKTGHTDGAGYCITVLGERDNMELIACVMGESESADRFEDATKLLNFGFSNYESREIVGDDQIVGKIKVKGGKQAELSLYPEEDLSVLIIKGGEVNESRTLDQPEELKAPINKGEKVGTLTVDVNGETLTTDLIAGETIEEKTFLDIAKELL